jgi:hypothetical protein
MKGPTKREMAYKEKLPNDLYESWLIYKLVAGHLYGGILSNRESSLLAAKELRKLLRLAKPTTQQ